MEQGATLEAVLRSEVRASEHPALAEAAADAIAFMADAAILLSNIMAAPPLAGRLGAAPGRPTAMATPSETGPRGRGSVRRRPARHSVACYRLRGGGGGDAVRRLREAGRGHRSPGRQLEHRCECPGRHHLLDLSDPSRARRQIRPWPSPDRTRPDRRGLLSTGPRPPCDVHRPRRSCLRSQQGRTRFRTPRGGRGSCIRRATPNMPSTPPTIAIGTIRSGTTSMIVCTAPMGPTGANFNMRWVARSGRRQPIASSCAAASSSIPADNRPGYDKGRLRLLYEANPIAFLAEQAGGDATDGIEPDPRSVRRGASRTRPVRHGFGRTRSSLVRRYHLDMPPPSRDSPLFGRRGLMRG